MTKNHEEKYKDYSRSELLKQIELLEKRKKYGIVWEEDRVKEEFDVESKNKLPVLAELKDREIQKDHNNSVNILIEGDNYHSLSVLNYTHKGKIDVIYIDPPYNTGNKTWKYNNRYVEREDAFKHSKFIAFMNKRLQLAKNLLTENGIIICAIDDYECHNVRHLFDEIFGEDNRLGTIAVIHNPGGRQDDKFFATAHEYMLVYAKNKDNAAVGYLDISEKKLAEYKYKDKWGKYKLREYRRSGANSRPEDRPNLWYPIYVNSKSLDLSIKPKSGYLKLLPIDSGRIRRVWRWNSETFMEQKEKYIEVRKNGKQINLFVKERLSDNEGLKPKTIWDESYYSSAVGTAELKNILYKEFKGNKIFEFPKSKFLVKDILKITSNQNSIILDYFAGSGTTGQAALELNAADNGKRRFILCTNNENGICNEVCYPRIRNVINGYTASNKIKIAGQKASLKYFKTEFVDSEPTDLNKKKLVDKSTEMLCLKEDCFDEVMAMKHYRIYKNSDNKFLGIIYDDEGIKPLKQEIHKIRKKMSVYVFSLDDSAREEEFEDVSSLVDLKPIPSVILNVYKRIFKC